MDQSQTAVFLRNVAPAGRQRPVRSAFNLRMHVLDPAVKVPFVGFTRDFGGRFPGGSHGLAR